MIGRVINGALLAALVLSAGQAWRLSARLATLQAEQGALQMRLAGCSGRLLDIIADKERDHAVDAIPDADLAGSVPGRWILPEK